LTDLQDNFLCTCSRAEKSKYKKRNLGNAGDAIDCFSQASLSHLLCPFLTDPCLLLVCSEVHVSSLVGLGTLLKKIGREEEGTELLHSETPSIPLSPSRQPSISLFVHSSLF
jgi:hypothetical protein